MSAAGKFATVRGNRTRTAQSLQGTPSTKPEKEEAVDANESQDAPPRRPSLTYVDAVRRGLTDRNLRQRGSYPKIDNELETTHSPKTSHNEASGTSEPESGHGGHYFPHPFDIESPPILVQVTERLSFAKQYVQRTQALNGRSHARREAHTPNHPASVEIVKAHRARLCRAVIILAGHEHLAETLFDWKHRDKIQGARNRGPKTYVLRGTYPQSSDLIPFQRVHLGPYTIPDEQGDRFYTSADDLLRDLNHVLGTEYQLDRPGLKTCLQSYVDEACDFGHIYGTLRGWWGRGNFNLISALLRERKVEDGLLRKNALDGDCIVNPHIPPRRVWDLFSNRVLPFHSLQVESPSVIPPNVWAVSHSWKPPHERRLVSTKINNGAWHVPLPKDTELHNLRIELLNLGAEYVFLDVLCLRQEDSSKSRKEFRRKKEWRLDVPTIGYVYRAPRITIIYFNGLGEELKLQPEGNFPHYHWFRRAWTLQEATDYWLPGGLSQSSLDTYHDTTVRWDLRTKFSYTLRKILKSTHDSTDEIALFSLLNAMRGRKYANPVDAIAGLAYPLRCKTLPIYNADSHDTEGAWEALIQSMHPHQRLLLLVCWGRAGGARRSKVDHDSEAGLYIWRPTWKELQSNKDKLSTLNLGFKDRSHVTSNADEALRYLPDAGHHEDSDAYFHYAYVVKGCTITLPSDPDGVESHSLSSRGGSGDEDYASESTLKYSPSSAASSRSTKTQPVTIEVWKAQSGGIHTFSVKSFVKPSQPGDIYEDIEAKSDRYPDGLVQHSIHGRERRVSADRGDSRGRSCVLVGVYGCRYWIVGIETGTRSIHNHEKVPLLAKVAVVTLNEDSDGCTPAQRNLGHVDIVAYC